MSIDVAIQMKAKAKNPYSCSMDFTDASCTSALERVEPKKYACKLLPVLVAPFVVPRYQSAKMQLTHSVLNPQSLTLTRSSFSPLFGTGKLSSTWRAPPQL